MSKPGPEYVLRRGWRCRCGYRGEIVQRSSRPIKETKVVDEAMRASMDAHKAECDGKPRTEARP